MTRQLVEFHLSKHTLTSLSDGNISYFHTRWWKLILAQNTVSKRAKRGVCLLHKTCNYKVLFCPPNVTSIMFSIITYKLTTNTSYRWSQRWNLPRRAHVCVFSVCVSALTLSGQHADTTVQPQAPFDVIYGTIKGHVMVSCLHSEANWHFWRDHMKSPKTFKVTAGHFFKKLVMREPWDILRFKYFYFILLSLSHIFMFLLYSLVLHYVQHFELPPF